MRINVEEDACEGGMSLSVRQHADGLEEIAIDIQLFYGDGVVSYEAEGTRHDMGPFQTEIRRRLGRRTAAPVLAQVDAAVEAEDVQDGLVEGLDHAYDVAVGEERTRHGAEGPWWYGTFERGEETSVGIGDLLTVMEDETGVDIRHYYDKCRAKQGV